MCLLKISNKKKSIKFAVLSVLIHIFVLLAIAQVMLPRHQPESKPQTITYTIKSYLIRKPAPKNTDENAPVEQSIQAIQAEIRNEDVSTSTAQEQATQVQPAQVQPAQVHPSQVKVKLPINSATKTPDTVNNTQESESLKQNEQTQTVSSVLNKSAKFIEGINQQARETMIEAETKAFQAPKPLVDKSKKLTTNQQLKANSASFVDPKTGIVVISTSGHDQITIRYGNACMLVTETPLDDKITRGRSRFTGTNACSGYDPFDEQLQKSLDKYLKQ